MLVARSGGRGGGEKYVGQAYDPAAFEVVEDGWDHDHCEVCWVVASRAQTTRMRVTDDSRGTDWLCTECYSRRSEPGGSTIH